MEREAGGRRRTDASRVPPLRSARPGDLESLWRLDRICFDEGIAYTRRELRRFLDLPGAECLLAEAGGRLLGFSLGYPETAGRGSGGVAHVVTLDVDPAARRSGLGGRLLEALLGRLAAAGATEARLEVDVRNAGAIAFYRALGFRRFGRIPDYYGTGLDAFAMRRVSPALRRSPSEPGGGAGDLGTRSPRPGG